jgi:ABC-type spermidine/putrescine transport system permease subunit II
LAVSVLLTFLKIDKFIRKCRNTQLNQGDFIRIKASLTTAFTFTSVFSAFLRMNLLNGISAALTVANAIFAVRTTVAFALAFALDISITGFQNAFSNRNVIAICIPSAVTGVCKKTILSVAGRDFKNYLPILQHTLLDIFVSKKNK